VVFGVVWAGWLMLDSYLMYLESLDVQVDRVDDEIAWRVSVGGL
jgi:hypothetical protein